MTTVVVVVAAWLGTAVLMMMFAHVATGRCDVTEDLCEEIYRYLEQQQREKGKLVGSKESVGFNADLMELQRLADDVLAGDPPAPGRLPITPPPLDPTIGVDVWPHDRAADLIVAWRHERPHR